MRGKTQYASPERIVNYNNSREQQDAVFKSRPRDLHAISIRRLATRAGSLATISIAVTASETQSGARYRSGRSGWTNYCSTISPCPRVLGKCDCSRPKPGVSAPAAPFKVVPPSIGNQRSRTIVRCAPRASLSLPGLISSSRPSSTLSSI